MAFINTSRHVDWKELRKTYTHMRDNVIGGDINGPLLLKAILDVMHDSRGFEDESSVKDTGPREDVASLYEAHSEEADDPLDTINSYYRGVLEESMGEIDGKEEDILPILMNVVKTNYAVPEFRSSYRSRTIADKILNKTLEIYESVKEMTQLLGSNVGGVASQYLN